MTDCAVGVVSDPADGNLFGSELGWYASGTFAALPACLYLALWLTSVAHSTRLIDSRRNALADVSKSEDRPLVLHARCDTTVSRLYQSVRIGRDVNGLAVRIDRSIAKTVLGPEVTAHVTGCGLSIGAKRQDV